MHHPFIPCFNRYMVECEWNIYLASSRLRWVLIDTWWNVNQIKVAGKVLYGGVLIDTWWNVNSSDILPSSSSVFCFNRYMVECELTKIVISSRG